ncbi:MAG: CopG family transcriptional regulator [Calothrix sp. FI2-JRJ7]|jgi:metal-responsive CopG/Arc/MetJ family transcriptional regulator|nr:CopG family transcriptional regulator [Calothrix sp. FI2-JRJ7]
MVKKVTITLDDDVLAFVDKLALNSENQGNRSALINSVFKELKKQRLQEELKAAYIQDSQDEAYRKEAAAWDITVGDGIE